MYTPPSTENLGPTKIWKLKKALHGLISAPKSWNDHLSQVLKRLGWSRSVLDECLFFKIKPEYKNSQSGNIDFSCDISSFLKDGISDSTDEYTKLSMVPISGILITYVDDIDCMGEKETIDEFDIEFRKECTCSDPEDLTIGGPEVTFLGFQYSRLADRIVVNPGQYTHKILDAFSALSLKPSSVPGNSYKNKVVLDQKTGRNINSPALNKTSHSRYRRIVGQLLWLSNVRRDISYGVKELSKFVHAPTEEDQQRATNLLKYLNGTKDLVLHLCPNKDDFFDIVTYTDSDLGGCETSRKSTSGGTLSISGSIVHS